MDARQEMINRLKKPEIKTSLTDAYKPNAPSFKIPDKFKGMSQEEIIAEILKNPVRKLPSPMIVTKKETTYKQVVTNICKKDFSFKEEDKPVTEVLPLNKPLAIFVPPKLGKRKPIELVNQPTPIEVEDKKEKEEKDYQWNGNEDIWFPEEDGNESPGRKHDSDYIVNAPSFQASKIKKMYEHTGVEKQALDKLNSQAEAVESRLNRKYKKMHE